MDRQQNPNYTPRHSPPSFTPFSQSPSSQIAPQQPSFDPFQRSDQRRDPFMPSSLSNRRDSQSGNGRLSNSIDVLQPPLQRPPSPFRPSPQSSLAHERRNSLESRYSGGPVEPGQSSQPSQQQSAPLLGRHMLPPSTSPKESPSHSYSNAYMRAPLPPSASKPRDAPQRSSSMSIQSIMGTDSGPKHSQSSWSATAGSSSNTYAPSPSPREQRYGGNRDSDAEPAPHTPIRRPDGPGYTPFERPLNSLLSTSSNSAKPYQSSDRDSQGLSRLLQPVHYPSEANNGTPSRPYSQPSNGEEANGPRHNSVSHDGRSTHGARDNYAGGTFENAVRDRSFSEQDRRHRDSVEHIPRPIAEPFSPVSLPLQPIHAPYPPRPMDYRDSLLNGNGQREPSNAMASPTGFRGSSASAQYSTVNGVTETVSEVNRGAENQSHSNASLLDGSRARTPPVDSQVRKSIEESGRQSFPRVANEWGRRPDRSSPLPQAVQGAQSQPAGSSRDPGVKSEFGRMFSGLGNGLRNTPQPFVSQSNGAGTPRRSPDEGLAEPERLGRRGGATAGGTRATGPGSRGGRRGKRPLLDEGRPESDEGDGRATPTVSTRGTKRGRYHSHTSGHHHHHHPQAPHHHHHHSRKPDEGPAFPLSRRTSGTPYSSVKFPASGSANGANVVAHHHHHHHPHANSVVPHHHHHLHKAVPDARIKRPVITVSTSPLLQSVTHLPRRHLGSQIYAPTLTVSPAASSTIDSPLAHQFLNKPNPLPLFDRSYSNSTFTIRVPRYYLSDIERQRICKARYLWGTEVYTDDSDPVAAAIHSGWIRGAWSGDVDVAMLISLSLPESAAVKAKDGAISKENESSAATLTAAPPNGPLPPPPNRDLHLTLLVLPPLEKYGGSARFGIKSRKWDDNHDGLSFKIEKVEWVDEGLGGRWEERGASAKRKRIAEAIATSRINAAPRQTDLGGAAPQDLKGPSQGLQNRMKKKATIVVSG